MKINSIPTVVPVYQIKAFLRRKVAVRTSLPALQPVMVNIQSAVTPRPVTTTKKYKKAVIIPDSQNGYKRDLDTGKLEPFHDRKAWDISRQIVADEKPDEIVLLGDMLDLPEWSDRFYRSPEFYFTTQPALLELGWWIGRLREAAPKAKVTYIEGNHEYRLNRAVGSSLIAAYGLRPVDTMDGPPSLSIAKLLSLDSIHVDYRGPYPEGDYWLNNKVRITHGEGGGGMGATYKAAQKAQETWIIGHMHRQEIYSRTLFRSEVPEVIQVVCPGTLARLDGAVPSYNYREDWQQGVLVVDYEWRGDDYQLTPVLIREGSAFHGGKSYMSAFDLRKLQSDTEWQHF